MKAKDLINLLFKVEESKEIQQSLFYTQFGTISKHFEEWNLNHFREQQYNFHLFTQLTLLKDSSLNELEYDYQYAELVNMYDEFMTYDNDDNIGLYESIEKYLKLKYN